MSNSNKGKEEDEVPPPQRPPSPPLHTTFASRGIHPPNFSAFKPREYEKVTYQAPTHVAWNCDGRKLGLVGIDKTTRVWFPEKTGADFRHSTNWAGGHVDDVDHMSWNPVHPDIFVTSSQKDKRIVFWDTRQSRYTQMLQFSKIMPMSTTWAPDGKTVLWSSAGKQIYVIGHGRKEGEDVDFWTSQNLSQPIYATNVLFSPSGEAVITQNMTDHTLKVLEYPSLKQIHAVPAHVGGCSAVALDPRGNYLASAGNDSIVNLFDLDDWICSKTITSCDHSITALSFSHDGEYIAISSQGKYIDICATETGMPLHRIPTNRWSPTVAWHPSKYIIAYCGHWLKPAPQQPGQRQEQPPIPTAYISLFGPGLPM